MELDLDQLEQELNEQLDALFRSVIDFNNHLVLYRLEEPPCYPSQFPNHG